MKIARVLNLPKISFGMIVLNGEPFLRYNLRAMYPFAHEIIIVEGASPGAVRFATPDGHSTDGTLDTLRSFQANEDPEGKLTVLTAEDEGHPDGFWRGEKHEQSQAYARRITGDYLWQVDVDEFYQPEDMLTVFEMLRTDRTITALSFRQIIFWGGFEYITDGWYMHRGWCAHGIHRVFKWEPGYHYATHRPVTVHNRQGVDLRRLHWLNGKSLARRGIYMYHYSLLLPQQVIEKSEYYKHADWARQVEAVRWAEDNFLKLSNPYRIHNVYDHPSWLERFRGNHPPQIEMMRSDLQSNRLDFPMRPSDDIEKLLHSPIYWLGRAGLKFSEPFSRWWRPRVNWRGRLDKLIRDPGESFKNLLRNWTA